MMKTDWLIVGGGTHGVHLAVRLRAELGVAAQSIQILDPGPTLLHRWKVRTSTVGMKYLRSPSVHHLDIDAWALQRFAAQERPRRDGPFSPPYQRPALDLFNAHCEQLITTHGLRPCHVQGEAVRGQIRDDGVMVTLKDGRNIQAERVVLALGAGAAESPGWAPEGDPRVQHIFRAGFDGWPQAQRERVLVVGGGISAGQAALRLLSEGHEVHLAVRRPLRKAQFDSDPGWIGPKELGRFHRESDPVRRRALIAGARNRGSLPPRLYRLVRCAEARGELSRHPNEIKAVEPRADGVRVTWADQKQLEVDRVVLATGLSRARPGGSFVESMIGSGQLPCAPCGYPIVDPSLRWSPRVYVTGPLAELEIGPVSGNIVGARKAGDRLVASLREVAVASRGAA